MSRSLRPSSKYTDRLLQEQHGMCRVLSYLIQSLSAQRAFGAKLSSPIRAQIPQKFSAMGTAGDFMIHVRLLVTVSCACFEGFH